MHTITQLQKCIAMAIVAVGVHSAVAADTPMYTPQVGSYLNGGIGLESRQQMQAERNNYNLHLRFAQAKTGEYLSAVSVLIESQTKKEAPLALGDTGPLLYVRLRPGTYRISAEFEGNKQVRVVRISKAASEHVIYWP